MPANLDLVCSINADWERGDFSRTDWAAPDIDYEIIDGPTPGRWQGVAAMNEAWRQFASAWEDFRAENEELRELDEERVIGIGHFSARGKASGVELRDMRTRGAILLHVRGGKVTRLAVYWQADRALADLGLED